jgi:hypothetical protein
MGSSILDAMITCRQLNEHSMNFIASKLTRSDAREWISQRLYTMGRHGNWELVRKIFEFDASLIPTKMFF